MKLALVFFAVVALAIARPQKDIEITAQSFDNIGLGDYSYSYAQTNGQTHNEAGQLKNIGGNDTVVASGSFSFVGPDGVTYTINYIADENGFQPQGDHIPRAA